MLEKQKEIHQKINDIVAHAAYLREDIFKHVLLMNFEDFDQLPLIRGHRGQVESLAKELRELDQALLSKDFVEIQRLELDVRRRIREMGARNDNVVPIESRKAQVA